MTDIKPIVNPSNLNVFSNEVDSILKSISETHSIDFEQLKKKYLLIQISLRLNLELKEGTERFLILVINVWVEKEMVNNVEEVKNQGSEFCLTHQRSLPQGRIDDNTWKEKEKGKRGRKKRLQFMRIMMNMLLQLQKL